MHSRKEGCFHRSYAKLIGTKKGSNPTGLVWVTNMASVSFLWDTNMANLKSSECHVILSTSYFLPLVQFLTLGFFFFSIAASARQQLDAWTVYLSAQHFVISQVVSVLCFLSIIHQPITPNYNSLGMCFVKHLQHAFYQALQFPHFLAHKFFRRVES